MSERIAELVAAFVKNTGGEVVTCEVRDGVPVLTFQGQDRSAHDDTLTRLSAMAFYCGLLDPANLADQLAAERFAIWLVLAPILGDLAELNRDNDDGHVTGFEITLFQRRMQAALEAIGQGLHRFEEPSA